MGQSQEKCSVRLCSCTPGENGVQVGLLSRDLHEETDPVLGVGLQVQEPPRTSVLSVLQFSTDVYYCSEEHGFVDVSVCRFGDTSRQASCQYTTQDGSAKASQRYIAQSGTLDFEPGTTVKTFRIQIIQDDRYESTLEFHVKIIEAHNAERGKYLYKCQVQVLDDDTFPTNTNRSFLRTVTSIEELKKGISGISLMKEYVQLNLANKTLRWKTIKWLIFDSGRGFYFLLTLWLNMYLVDEIIMGAQRDEEEEIASRTEGRLLLQTIHAGARALSSYRRSLQGMGSEADLGEEIGDGFHRSSEATKYRQHQALVVAFLYVIPFFFILVLEIQKVSLAIPGICRKSLQGSLFRKFLNFREATRLRVSSGQVSMAMTRDIPEVVESGYVKILEMTRKLTKMAMVFIFVLSENRMAVVPLLIFPLLQLFFLKIREASAIDVDMEMDLQQDRMVHAVNNATDNIRTVVGFHLRPQVVAHLEGHIDRYNKSCGACARTFVKHAHLAPTLTVVFVGGWMVLGTFQLDVFGGWLSLGTFMATIAVFKEVGAEMQDIYFDLMEIQSAIGPLRKITSFMNMSTDLEQRMEIAKERHNWGLLELETALSQLRHEDLRRSQVAEKTFDPRKTAAFSCDLVKISLSDVTFAYGGLSVFVEDCNNEEEIEFGMLHGRYVSFGALDGCLRYEFDGHSPAAIEFDQEDRRWKLYGDRYEKSKWSYASDPVSPRNGRSGPGRPPSGTWNSPDDPNMWITVAVATSGNENAGRGSFDFRPSASVWLQQTEKLPTTIVDRVTISFEQGCLHAIVGNKHEGKATFLKLLGQVIVPQEGFVGVPLHLRVLHVDRQAEILDTSLFRNLVIHDSAELSNESIDRILRICEKCRFSRDMLSLLKTQAEEYRGDLSPSPLLMTKRATTTVGESKSKGKALKDDNTTAHADGGWEGRLTQTDSQRLSIARALVYNPELLVMHTPLLVFDDDEARRLLGLITEHIDSRGLACNTDDQDLRRPRTVFMSCKSAARATGAHHVYTIFNGGVIEITDPEVVPPHSHVHGGSRGCAAEIEAAAGDP